MPDQANSKRVRIATEGYFQLIRKSPVPQPIFSSFLSKQEISKGAQALIDALDERQKKDPDIRKSIADLKTAKGENLTASHDLKELASCYPDRAEHWLNWAASLKSLKFTVAPELILKRGIQFNPEDNNLWLALEQILFEMCNFESAQKNLYFTRT